MSINKTWAHRIIKKRAYVIVSINVPPLLGGSIPVSFRKVSTVYLTSSKDAPYSCSSATFARIDDNCSSVN
jgi:hypothetical protein